MHPKSNLPAAASGRGRYRAAALAVVALTAVTTGCGLLGRPTPENVILIVVDTLRADHMSAYGYERSTTPNVESWLAEAVLFEHARSQAACTFPSVNSLLTSRYGAVFHRQPEGELGIPQKYLSLQELLQQQGFATLAVSASPIVRATPSEDNPKGGFGRGFEVFDESCEWREAACLNTRALELLDGIERPFFLYLHYMEPHDPYDPPPQAEARTESGYEGPDFIAAGDPNPIAEMLYDDGPPVEFTQQDVDHLIERYDDEITYFDLELGRLLQALRQRGLYEETLFVLASDHGEEFLEHGHMKHCRVLFDASTRTPLIVRVPGVRGGRRVKTPVENLDITPTILDYFGLLDEELRSAFRGRTLHPLLEGDRPAQRFAHSDQGKWRSVDDGRWKLIVDGVTMEMRLFDLEGDPDEQRDLFASRQAMASRLQQQLRVWFEVTEPWLATKAAVAAAKAKQDELRALGYLE